MDLRSAALQCTNIINIPINKTHKFGHTEDTAHACTETTDGSERTAGSGTAVLVEQANKQTNVTSCIG